MKIREFLDKRKFLLCVVLLTLLVAAACIGLTYKVIAQGVMVWWLAILLAFGVISIPVIAFLIRRKKLSVQIITVLILAVLGVLYTFVFTPNSVPDEPLHYRTAYHISNQMLFKFGDEQENMIMRAEDNAFITKTSIILSDDQYINVSNNSYLFCKDNKEIRANQTFIENKTLPYVASAIGISIGRIANFSAFWTYQAGRIFNLISFLIFVYFAIKLMPFNKVAIAAVAMLPVNLHIIASVSYDVFTVGGVLLLFAYIMNLRYGQKKIGLKQLGILAIIIALVIPQKVAYIGVAALVLLLPKENFKTPKLHFLFKCLLGLIAIGSILIVQMQNAAKLVADSVTYDENIAGYNLQYVFAHLGEIAKMLFNTICYKTDFYIKSVTGHFGWFQIEAPWFITIPILMVVAVSFMRKTGEPKAENTLAKLYSLALFVAVFLMVELLMLLDHTVMGSAFVEGVQGRYFIPALPLLFLVLRNNMIQVDNKTDDAVLILMHALNVLNIIFCVFAITVIMQNV